MDKIIVTIFGVLSIIGIYWFFFGKKRAFRASDDTTIIVDGGYKPSVIKIARGIPTTLTFIRKDKNSCLEELIIPDFKVKEYLPLNQPVSVTFTPSNSGTAKFHCAMNMFQGKIEIV